jgi:teichuronic acid biosynthesis glycosyltransferase TuaC
MRVLVVAEYYPRVAQPAFGVWAHRQALAARDAGAEIRVLVLHRPIPSLQALRRGELRGAWAGVAQPRRVSLDGLTVDYLRYLSPPRPRSYGRWGACAAPLLRRVLPRLHREFPFELIHAHYAVPAGDAVRRAAPAVPTVVSVHGGDVHGRHAAGPFVAPALAHARVVMANSAGTAKRCRALGAGDVRVVHLGADLPPDPLTGPRPAGARPTIVTVGNLIARKRHVDVIAALPGLVKRYPGLRYRIVGDGPEREPLRALATQLGVADHVELLGALGHAGAVAEAQAATLFVLPSVSEAFGVSYIEAMAAGVPAVGCRGEDGPEEIAASGGGIELVPPHNPAALAAALDELLSDPQRRDAVGQAARATVERSFTWERCGTETVAVYSAALRARG